jgi:hypothetical protein
VLLLVARVLLLPPPPPLLLQVPLHLAMMPTCARQAAANALLHLYIP